MRGREQRLILIAVSDFAAGLSLLIRASVGVAAAHWLQLSAKSPPRR